MTSTTLSLTVLNGEPRIYDLDLAERLGFAELRAIRKIIKRNEAKLLSFGTRATVSHVTITGQPYEEFYLNQMQAIFICMKSETDKAFEVQIEIVHVFDAYLRGGSVTVAMQPAMHHCLVRALRCFDLTRDAWARQVSVNQIKVICQHLTIAVPNLALVGKPADQMQLEM